LQWCRLGLPGRGAALLGPGRQRADVSSSVSWQLWRPTDAVPSFGLLIQERLEQTGPSPVESVKTVRRSLCGAAGGQGLVQPGGETSLGQLTAVDPCL